MDSNTGKTKKETDEAKRYFSGIPNGIIGLISEFLDKKGLVNFAHSNKTIRKDFFSGVSKETLKRFCPASELSFETAYTLYGDFCKDINRIKDSQAVWYWIKESDRTPYNFKKLFGLANEKEKNYKSKIEQLQKLDVKDRINLFRSFSSYGTEVQTSKSEAPFAKKLKLLKLFFPKLQDLKFDLQIQLIMDFIGTAKDANASEEDKKTPKIEVSVLSDFFPNRTKKFAKDNQLVARLNLVQVADLLKQEPIKELDTSSKVTFLSKFCAEGREKTDVTKNTLSKFLSDKEVEKLDTRFQNQQNLKLEEVLFKLFPAEVGELPSTHIYLKANFFKLFENDVVYAIIRNVHTKRQLLSLAAGDVAILVESLKSYNLFLDFNGYEDTVRGFKFLKWLYGENKDKLLAFMPNDIIGLVSALDISANEFLKWLYGENKNKLLAFMPRDIINLASTLSTDPDEFPELLEWIFGGKEGNEKLNSYSFDDVLELMSALNDSGFLNSSVESIESINSAEFVSVVRHIDKPCLTLFKMVFSSEKFSNLSKEEVDDLCDECGKTKDELKTILKEKETMSVGANAINKINSIKNSNSVEEEVKQNLIGKNTETSNMSLVNNSGETMINSEKNIDEEEHK